MKLSNYITLRLTMLFIVVLLLWSVIYFFVQMNEVYDGIDEGLNNLRQELIHDANTIPGFIEKMDEYEPFNLVIKKITFEEVEPFKEYYSTEDVYFQSEDEYEEVRMLTTAFYCTQNGHYYIAKFFTSTVDSDDLIKNMFYLLVSLWFIISLMLLITTKRIIYKTNRPFYFLLDKLKTFNLDESKVFDFPATKIKEYEELNKSVKTLLHENINTYSEQKQFIENATHELQTPIAIAMNKLEQLMNDTNLNEQQLYDINSVVNILGRAKRLNNSLLLLSKIKNKQFSGIEEICLNDVFAEVLENFDDLINYKQIAVNVINNATVTKMMNRDLAFILANNLVKNAVAHNLINGKIEIVFKENSIDISNAGESISKDVDIFERYVYRGESSRSSGLGLSIVKTIVDSYNMNIKHVYNNGIHTVTLRL